MIYKTTFRCATVVAKDFLPMSVICMFSINGIKGELYRLEVGYLLNSLQVFQEPDTFD